VNKVRVLVVDDSAAVRRLLREVLSSEPEIEVAGVAANGKIALAMITQVQPDCVVLDIEMPEMDGLQTLRAIRALDRRIPVLMFSSLTERGAAATLDALALGATDYITKPASGASLQQSAARIREQLASKVKELGAAARKKLLQPQSSVPKPTLIHAWQSRRIDVVAIGTSTGGPNALAAVLADIPPDFPVPIVVVQHMPPVFTRMLADRLNATSRLTVREAVSGTYLLPGQACLAPGDFHLTLQREGTRAKTVLTHSLPENSCRPSVDVLFRSVAEMYGAGVLAIVLTGMGQDGLLGCEAVRSAGGQIMVQDEASSVVWGMPGFVARAGLADNVLPLAQIGPSITRKVSEHRNGAGAALVACRVQP
jgi:two-component system chemotaxis response regulator CheB